MKRVGFISVIILILLTGCTDKKEKLMENYAKSYYDEYMSNVVGLTEARISIKDLKNMNNSVGSEKYDLSSFNGCNDDSYVRLILNGKDIQEYKFHLDC